MNKLIVPNASGEDLLEAYRWVVQLQRPDLVSQFERRCRDNPGSARCEALVFSLLRDQFGLEPRIHEDRERGGPDFHARHALHPDLFVEVKYLDSSAVTNNSKMANAPPEGFSWFEYVTPQLKSDLTRAARQLGGLPGPGVCIIGSDHAFADRLLGPWGAENLLTSGSSFVIPLAQNGGPAGPMRVETDLRHAAFLKLDQEGSNAIKSLRQSISAIILLPFDADRLVAYPLGILHHDPARPLDPRVFPGIHFARLRESPRAGGSAVVEYVVHEPNPHPIQLLPPKLREEDLR